MAPVGSPGSGLNPLVDAASSLLSLLATFPKAPTLTDPMGLRARLELQMRNFGSNTRQARATAETLKDASYCLCTAIDEAVLRTPWGGASDWRKLSLLSELHGDAWGGDKFFDILQARMRDPGPNIDLLELLYICLALGFQGKYALFDDGHKSLERIAGELYDLIRRQRGEQERDLSPHWRNEEAARVALEHPLPLWVLAAVAASLLLAIYIGFRFFLADQSGPALDRLGAFGRDKPAPVIVKAEPARTPAKQIPTAQSPEESRSEPLVPPEPSEAVNLAGQLGAFLQPEIDERLVSVLDSPTQVTIRITGSGLFAPGSDQLAPAYVATFQRIRTAIAEHQQDIPGDLIVVGHTDNVPLKRSLRFQDNYDLSRARAESVARILAEDKRITSKIEKDGRGPSEPVSGGDPATGNDTQEKRDKNRRVEILIEK